MANDDYAYLISEVASRLNRDDLDDPTATPVITTARKFIQAQILYFQREVFYASHFTDASKSTTIGSPWVDLLTGWNDVSMVRIKQSGTQWIPLTGPVDYNKLVQKETQVTPPQSLPTEWARYNNPSTLAPAIRLYPTPNLVYPLEFTMDKPPAAPVADGDSNFWTTDAAELIIEAAIETLCKRKINNPVRGETAREAKYQELRSLFSKTLRSMGTIQIQPHW